MTFTWPATVINRTMRDFLLKKMNKEEVISRGDFYRLFGSVSNLSGRFCSLKSSWPLNLFIFMASICLFVLFPRSTHC